MNALPKTPAALLLVALFAPALHAQSFEVLGGRDPQTGAYFGFQSVTAASDDGAILVSGGHYLASGARDTAPWILDGDDEVRLDALDGMVPLDLSGDGHLVAGIYGASGCASAGNPVNDCQFPFTYRWADGTHTALPMSGIGSGGAVRVEGMAVSADGAVVVATFRVSGASPTTTYHTYRWTNGVREQISEATNSGGVGFTRVADVSADGSVILGTGAPGSYGALLYDGAFTVLPCPPGCLSSGVTSRDGLSPDGRFAVGRELATEDPDFRPVRWDDGAAISLGFAGAAGTPEFGMAQAVSRDGALVLGEESNRMPSNQQLVTYATLWTPTGGMRRLIDVFQGDHGFDLSAFNLGTGGSGLPGYQMRMTPGRVVIGQGRLLTNVYVAWRAVLTPEEITVNDTGDEPDAAADDGICDTDPAEPGEQCTLRAAIETANTEGGDDRIVFDVGGDALGGVATIVLEGPLPPITEPVEIDAAAAPPAREVRRLP